MQIDRAELEARFRDLSDEELRERILSGVLTELAADVARAEAATRGLDTHQRANDAAVERPDSMPAHGALRVCATFMNPLVAEALAVRLLAEAERIRAAFDAGEYAIDEDFDVDR